MGVRNSVTTPKSGYNKGTIRSDIRYLGVSKDVRRHRLISSDYITTLPCHGRGRKFESRRPRHIFKELGHVWKIGAIDKKIHVARYPVIISSSSGMIFWLSSVFTGPRSCLPNRLSLSVLFQSMSYHCVGRTSPLRIPVERLEELECALAGPHSANSLWSSSAVKGNYDAFSFRTFERNPQGLTNPSRMHSEQPQKRDETLSGRRF